MTMPKEIWVTPIEINQNDLDTRPEFDIDDYGRYINHTVHESEIAKRDKALEVAREVLRDNKTEFWEDWHSHMSEGEFENNPTIMDIDKALRQINEILGGGK